jgi:hypothetical protein
MTNVKNFSLIGVGSSVQLGKGGSRLKSDAGKIVARNAADDALVNIQAAAPSVSADVVTLGYLNTLSGINIQNGMNLPLGTPTDGSLSGGAVPLVTTDTVTNAIDGLNEVLGLLVPSQPPNFPNSQSLTVTSVGTSPVLASGSVPDNTGDGTLPAVAGGSVTRVTAGSVSSSTIADTGPGNQGTITAYVNGTASGSRTLTTGVDNGTYTSLVISDDKAYPSDKPGFWETIDARITAAVNQGWNRFRIAHDQGGTTNEPYFVRDNLTANPVLAGGTVAEGTAVLAYSSGVPHYGTGSTLSVSGLTMTNLAGETYYSGNPVSISGSNSTVSSTGNGFSYADCGIATPIARQTTTAQSLSALTVSVNGSTFNAGSLTATAQNVNGTGTRPLSTPNILVKTSSSGRFDEMLVPTNGLPGSSTSNLAPRIQMITGDTPAATFTGTASDWTASAALNTWDAAVVAGTLSHNVTNYSTGYLPAGPNYSVGRSGDQYVTFWFRNAPVSKFDILVAASGVAGCWVKLVGVSDSYSSANGWWNMNVAYGGAGTPGNIGSGNGSLGCALGGIMPTGTTLTTATKYTATFGQVSSSSATNNSILVRFKLTSGQSITSLGFDVASH